MPDMTLNPRQTALLEEVRTQGFASIDELARKFGVTLQTVRRDVNLLAENGMLARFHGGVRVEGSTTENIAYRQRQVLNAEGKARIARAVAAAVPEGCSLILNIGTTPHPSADWRHRRARGRDRYVPYQAPDSMIAATGPADAGDMPGRRGACMRSPSALNR